MKNLIFTNSFKNENIVNKEKLGLWAEDKLIDIKKIDKYDYRWNSPIFLKQDIYKIKLQYFKYLKEISKNLNKYHSENYDNKYWEIILGPWLNTFLSIIYDRYQSLKYFSKNNKNVSSSTFFIFDEIKLRPKNSYQFKFLSQSDLWNQFIYQKIAENSSFFKKIKIYYLSKMSPDFIDTQIASIYPNKKQNTLKIFLKKNIVKIFTQSKKINLFLYDSGLSYKTTFSLWTNINKLVSTSLFDFDVNKNNQNRSFEFIESKKKESELESINRILINELMPESFVESYSTISKNLKKNYNFIPKIIFTSFGYKVYDCFKIWSAKNIFHHRSKLILFQHGGFGTYENSLDEDHQISISNVYLSWGWTYPKQKKIKPFFTSFKYPNVNLSKINKIMMVTAIKSKYSNTLYTGYHSSSWVNYIKFLDLFFQKTSSKIKSNLILKGYTLDYGWDYTELLKKNHKEISIYNDNKSFGELVKIYKLNIITYNGTSLLQSLSSGNPTIILWDSSIWRTSSISKKYFKLLQDCQILFDDIGKASIHLNNIYDDIDSWWNQSDLQKNLNLFVNYFSRNTNQFDNELIKELKKIND